MLETIKLLKNKVRIWFLKRFTNRVKEIVIKDEKTGHEEKVTTEQRMEKVCDHSIIRMIAPTFFVCDKCHEQYFFIYHWITARPEEVMSHIEQMADHFDMKLVDKDGDGQQ